MSRPGLPVWTGADRRRETDMELGSWSIIQAPSLLALIPWWSRSC